MAVVAESRVPIEHPEPRPDEEKSTVFDRSEKGFEDPGTGFGLYLIKEIVDSYDGRITVEDNTPQEARFLLTFQRAGPG